MHEFSLAQNILEIVQESASSAKVRSISEIHLEIGALSGVETDALLTALKALKPKTIIESSEIIINHVKAEANCLNCNNRFQPEQIFDLCPRCSSFNFDILQGKEFSVKSIVANK